MHIKVFNHDYSKLVVDLFFKKRGTLGIKLMTALLKSKLFQELFVMGYSVIVSKEEKDFELWVTIDFRRTLPALEYKFKHWGKI